MAGASKRTSRGTAKQTTRHILKDDSATAQAGADIALALKAPLTIHLAGDLGAGKSALARAIIRKLTGEANAEVPSPTFSLVQHYTAQVRGKQTEILHADLYRITDHQEVVELGLSEPADNQILLIEWAERGGEMLPPPDLVLTLAAVENADGSESRELTFSGTGAVVASITRSLQMRAFLDQHARRDADRHFLLGDASARSYETIQHGGETLILMNAPRMPDGPPIRDGKPYSRIAHLAEDVSAFVGVAQILEKLDMCVPKIHAADLDAGLLLIEDLGEDGIIDAERKPVATRYLACGQMLAVLHEKPLPSEISIGQGRIHQVPAYDRSAMTIEAELLTDWYLPARMGRTLSGGETGAFREHWSELFDLLEQSERHLVLRDFHSPNILWQAGQTGHKRVGLIDFQDAVIGPCAYDVASLAQDARVDIPAELEEAVIDAYVSARKASGAFDESGFRQACAIMAAQRATKILGIFIRLDRRDAKPAYLKHLPRMEAYLSRSLAHPALHGYRDWLGSVLAGCTWSSLSQMLHPNTVAPAPRTGKMT